MIDLLSPAGDFDCLKAAVQNGADSVYFGTNLFSARASATNFNLKDLEKAIIYAKTRGVKTYLTLNTLLTNSEIKKALEIVESAYSWGIDAIIVQDLGFAKLIHENFPDLPLHASTQMSIHNLQGVKMLEEIGFSRVVLARELSLFEIEHICKNSNIEIECFVHGALCISYSGQCLFSSLIGGRSGNRGKCAQPCRLPYKLIENNMPIDDGFLLSTKDLCSIDLIPKLINAGVCCFKIEGRMKKPEYVATITKIYRKYIDLAYNNDDSKPYDVAFEDKKELLQVFNRGLSSTGHLSNEANTNLIFKEKPNNMGLYLGRVEAFNKNKGHIKIKLNENIEIGDTISFENEPSVYKISELMIENNNIKQTSIGQTVTLGRMKGNINLGDKVFKLSSKKLVDSAILSYNNEYRKIDLSAFLSVKAGQPIKLQIMVAPSNTLKIYENLNIMCESNVVPEAAKNKPITKEQLIAQLNKTADSIFNFKNIEIDLDDGLFIPKISTINQLRRDILQNAYLFTINNFKRLDKINNMNGHLPKLVDEKSNRSAEKTVSLLLNCLNINFNYSQLKNVNNVYIPLKFFNNSTYAETLQNLQEHFSLYIYMPTIIKSNYINLFYNNIKQALETYKIAGFVISNISNFKILEEFLQNPNYKFEIVANYTFNVFNSLTVEELKKLNINKFTISPESNEEIITSMANNALLPSELIVYGNTPLMNTSYCLLGHSNKCYPSCLSKCQSCNSYFLRDRLNMNFRILIDNVQTVSTIYNSKITSISSKNFNCNSVRVDIIDESISEINYILEQIKIGKRLEGNNYTNGNLKRSL